MPSVLVGNTTAVQAATDLNCRKKKCVSRRHYSRAGGDSLELPTATDMARLILFLYEAVTAVACSAALLTTV